VLYLPAMAIEARSDLFRALALGEFQALVGAFEGGWLECKREPYRLREEDQQLELAKDVAGLANSGGGVIVVGYETSRDPTSARDRVARLTPVRADLVSRDAHLDAVERLTYPPIRNLAFRWWETAPGQGVATIEVEAADEADAPVLVVRARTEGSRRDLLLGVFHRSDDRVSRLTPSEIHAQIQLGRLVQRGGGLPQPAAAPVGPSTEERAARLADDVAAADLVGDRRYWLQAWPATAAEVQGLYASGPDGFRSLLVRPPAMRRMGFGVRTGASGVVQLTGAPGLRAVGPRGALSLLRTGLLTWVVPGGTEYLSRGDERRQWNSISPIVLVESTFEFARFFLGQVLPRCEPRPARWFLGGGMADLRAGNHVSSLPTGALAVEDNLYSEWRPAGTDAFEFGPVEFRAGEQPGVVAYRALREVYAGFGVDTSEIPFTEGAEVSEALLRALG